MLNSKYAYRNVTTLMRLVGKKMSRKVGGEVERGMKIDEHNFAVTYHVGMVWAMSALGRGRFGPWDQEASVFLRNFN